MPSPRIVKKSNPEIEQINPESFKLPEEGREEVSSPERPDFSPEKTQEKESREKELGEIELEIEGDGTQEGVPTSAISFHKRREKEIEQILASGLHDIFLKMQPKKQQEFKLAGESTSRKINLLLDKSRVNVSKIIKLIRRWLKMIPGVNEFFLEKEAKIKADKIINIKDRA